MLEPKFNRVPNFDRKGRWRWYYPAIADWMLDHPGRPQRELAEHLGKNQSTISAIIQSDTFKEYFRQRREQWTKAHDLNIINKTTKVAEAALDLMLEKIEKQGDKIPMQLVNDVATSALDRLGYAPKPQNSVSVNVDQSDNRQQTVVISVNASALEEARDALRVAEQQRLAARGEGLIEYDVVDVDSIEVKDPSNG